ncbi:formamidopyrimidine-DNA glycosylase [Arthrobacter crystallopoietes BAB-32]|uniref:DNA-(apurinic or apyrimidinic site) lyase n=1 Tax=Arthrobacter crystallopoietes BAB-32 TaxID=1246476 RepID=N1V1P7_9MICC|nr:DNA-formamidopyrimidine glycosylase family protein [Arthrobacter crystallopoietes]EMY35255.1 formamidopyrimidine-DNA glycosylase [Arthrobacter crystallopoietes BAB-32]
MPEGHSIHRLAAQFNSVFAGERLAVSSPQGRFAAGAALIDGEKLEAAHAHGKQLFLEFSNGLVLRVHLGLYGAWDFGGDSTFRGSSSIGAPRRVGEREMYDDGAPVAYSGPPEPVGQVRARLVSSHGWADLRGPTACEVLTGAERDAVVGRLGPDPLDPGADAQSFIERVRAKKTAVGTLLMDQSVVAGVGNIYRAESLFRQGISPYAPGKSLSADEVQALWQDLVGLLQDGVRDGRIVTTRPSDRFEPEGAAAATDAHYVYQRQGQDCRVCTAGIRLDDMGGRKLYWCPGCQQ